MTSSSLTIPGPPTQHGQLAHRRDRRSTNRPGPPNWPVQSSSRRPRLSVPAVTVDCCTEEYPAPSKGAPAPSHCRGPPVTYVRPHYRRDGTFVRGHNRRTRPRTAQSSAAARHTTAQPRPVPAAALTTYVHPYYRSDGTRVRGHHRSIHPRTVAVAAGTGGAGLVVLLVLLAFAGEPGSTTKAPASTTPSQSASTPAIHRR
ncbi:hypothetical protein SGPA1_50487 [Streptomyces misionensis JCM 4497]